MKNEWMTDEEIEDITDLETAKNMMRLMSRSLVSLGELIRNDNT
jgi:hypothetical protein